MSVRVAGGALPEALEVICSNITLLLEAMSVVLKRDKRCVAVCV